MDSKLLSRDKNKTNSQSIAKMVTFDESSIYNDETKRNSVADTGRVVTHSRRTNMTVKRQESDLVDYYEHRTMSASNLNRNEINREIQ